jgi:hypothetical protein
MVILQFLLAIDGTNFRSAAQLKTRVHMYIYEKINAGADNSFHLGSFVYCLSIKFERGC